nr:right-handed parallel beta-helix repeat-containing protein [uncultured Desulfobacter sp.]
MLKRVSVKKISWILAICMAAILLAGSGAWAKIIHVDSTVEPEGDGTSASPYRTIQEAVDNAVNLDVISVRAGAYTEDVIINGKGIKLVGADPKTTVINGVDIAIKMTGVFTAGENVVDISGFTIRDAAGSGIYSDSASVVAHIHNNILSYNRFGAHLNENCTFIISNNTIVNNTSRGITTYSAGSVVKMFNNVFGSNPVAFDDNSSNGYAGVYAYNNNWNTDSNEGSIEYSSENINLAAQFTNPEEGDYTFLETSPCIDAGRQTAADNDPDGTRNDMGVYGGPGAAAFWPETAGGPVVTELTVTPASVSQSGTITIRAKAIIP